jgi:uncharacterized glyoxalase superfamily protein PhnB
MLQSTESRLTRAAPEVPVADLEEALAYYGDRLGFRTVSRFPAGEYAVVERDDVALHLFSDGDAPAAVSFHIFVDGLDPLERELGARGARISQPAAHKPWGTRDFRVVDPFGNEIKFTEPAR